MDDKHRLQNDYYQTIAREFLRKRGAPFFLSPRDLSLIADWENRRIPLDAVLEGLSLAFDRRKLKPRRDSAVPLGFCARDVERAWAQSRVRMAGSRRTPGPKTPKRDVARTAVERFLGANPPGWEGLMELYRRGLEVLSSAKPDEHALERLDEEADEILWKRSPAEERDARRRAVREEFKGKNPEDLERISRALVVKSQRERNRIPYFSLFYY